MRYTHLYRQRCAGRLATAGLLLCTAISVLSGCSQSDTAAQSEAERAAAVQVASMILLDAVPEGAVDVRQAKQTASEGEQIVLRGVIGGRRSPFVESRAVFMIADRTLPSCDDDECDACPTPWDYCCTPRDELTANTATVQMVDAEGNPIMVNLRHIEGIEPLREIIIVGTVGPRPTPDVLTVNAHGLRIISG